MPRKPRLLFDNAVYHVFNRGHNKRRLFMTDRDFRVFKQIVKDCKNRIRFELYNYAFMPNHFHFLLKTSNGKDLPEIMKKICQRYANYYKKTYNHTGYLFENRYKSIYVDRDEYIFDCARYIERNPLRGNLVKNILDYKWTSYAFYVCGEKDNITDKNPAFLEMGENENERRKNYERFVMTPRYYEKIVNNRLIDMIIME